MEREKDRVSIKTFENYADLVEKYPVLQEQEGFIPIYYVQNLGDILCSRLIRLMRGKESGRSVRIVRLNDEDERNGDFVFFTDAEQKIEDFIRGASRIFDRVEEISKNSNFDAYCIDKKGRIAPHGHIPIAKLVLGQGEKECENLKVVRQKLHEQGIITDRCYIDLLKLGDERIMYMAPFKYDRNYLRDVRAVKAKALRFCYDLKDSGFALDCVPLDDCGEAKVEGILKHYRYGMSAKLTERVLEDTRTM